MLNNRPDRVARIMMELDLKAQWATCQRRRVASALVDAYGMVKIPAYNGTPMGQPPCRTLTTPNSRCQYCIHSEKNCINHAARSGVATQNLQMFTLSRPCLGCSNDIVQAGISAVYYREDYDSDGQKAYVLNMFGRKGIFVKQIPMSTYEKTFNKMLEEWRVTWDYGLQDMPLP